MVDLLRHHSVPYEVNGEYRLTIGENKIAIVSDGASRTHFFYRRFDSAGELISEFMIPSDSSALAMGIFPSPALLTPKRIANYAYLKFKSPVIVDQKSDAIFYSTMPIEIAVYKQSKDEEILLDAFSLQRQQYALYGSPESGVLCRYKEVEVNANKDKIRPMQYEEALVRIAVRNDIDNVVKVSKVIIPVDGVILDHARDDSWLPGSVEMSLSHAFGKDITNVRLVGTKVKRADKTSVAQGEDSLLFLMDAGY